jgi:hypothetical protein
MSDQGSLCDFASLPGAPLKTTVNCVGSLVPEGPLRILYYVVVTFCILLAPFIFAYYFNLLAHGAKPEGSIQRQDYDRLQAKLAGDNVFEHYYREWLEKFLNWIDWFFRDKHIATRTPFLPRLLRLTTPAPLWTAPALDRCLFLALVYPIAMIFIIWVLSGHAGSAGVALGLPMNVSNSWRFLTAIIFCSFCLVLWNLRRTHFIFLITALFPLILAIAIAINLVSTGRLESSLGIFVTIGIVIAVVFDSESRGLPSIFLAIFIITILSDMIILCNPILLESIHVENFVFGGTKNFISDMVIILASTILLYYSFLICIIPILLCYMTFNYNDKLIYILLLYTSSFLLTGSHLVAISATSLLVLSKTKFSFTVLPIAVLSLAWQKLFPRRRFGRLSALCYYSWAC